jgi:ribonuclease HI
VEVLDAARLDDVPLTHVKGHSGDPDNERVDRIAVAFSQGAAPDLAVGVKTSLAPAPPNSDLAPAPLQQLLTRLELADRLAEGAFALTVIELAQLVEQPMKQLEAKDGPWIWRDWLVSPRTPVAGACSVAREDQGSRETPDVTVFFGWSAWQRCFLSTLAGSPPRSR